MAYISAEELAKRDERRIKAIATLKESQFDVPDLNLPISDVIKMLEDIGRDDA